MTADETHLVCQLALIGAITYTGYSIYKLSESQKAVTDTAVNAMYAYSSMSDKMNYILEHLVEEKIA